MRQAAPHPLRFFILFRQFLSYCLFAMPPCRLRDGTDVRVLYILIFGLPVLIAIFFTRSSKFFSQYTFHFVQLISHIFWHQFLITATACHFIILWWVIKSKTLSFHYFLSTWVVLLHPWHAPLPSLLQLFRQILLPIIKQKRKKLLKTPAVTFFFYICLGW